MLALVAVAVLSLHQLYCCVSAGNPSQHTGLLHAALPEHAVAVGGSVGACGGRDALPTRPVQVQG